MNESVVLLQKVDALNKLKLHTMKTDPKKALNKYFKADLEPTKFNLLNMFENELKAAVNKDKFSLLDKQGRPNEFTKNVQLVVDKYMNMDTDLFDSDDLNQIIDSIENEKIN